MPVNSVAGDSLPPMDTHHRNSYLLRIWIPHISIKGGFDTHRYYMEDSTSVVLPKLNGKVGFGAAFGGQRRYSMWKLEFSGGLYWAPMEYASQGIRGKAVAGGLELDFSASFGVHPINQSGQLRPMVLVGLSFDYLDIERGAIDPSGITSDIYFRGGSLKAGGGFDLVLSGSMVLNGKIIYRWYEFDTLRIEDELFSIPYVRCEGLNYIFGLTFYFNIIGSEW